MIKAIINGCNGRMGKAVTELAAQSETLRLVAGIDIFAGNDPLPYPYFSSLDDCHEQADVIIDFSRPEGLPGVVKWAVEHNCALLIATTGLSEEDMALLKAASATIPVLQSANLSLGINLMLELLPKMAAFLGEGYDVEIIEMHHNTKVDSPSGTAYALANAVADSYEEPREFVHGRHTLSQRRAHNEIGIHAVRGGTLCGEHQVHFIGTDEVIEIKHTAYSRRVLAAGALRAAEFAAVQQPGMYRMADMFK